MYSAENPGKSQVHSLPLFEIKVRNRNFQKVNRQKRIWHVKISLIENNNNFIILQETNVEQKYKAHVEAKLFRLKKDTGYFAET